MKKFIGFLTASLLALLMMPYGGARADDQTAVYLLKAQNGSGEDGAVRITPLGPGQVRVVISATNGSATPQPAHIHKGSCANLDPTPAYPLNDVVNGASDTTVNVGIQQLQSGLFAVNVHKSAAEVGTYVACADIVASGPILTVKIATQNNSGEYGGARITLASATASRVEVTLVQNGATTPQPAHIHKGSCANLDPTPAYPLNNVINGASDTNVPVSIEELAKGGYAINVHKSAAEVGVYVACGDIESQSLGPAPGMPTTGSPPAPMWPALAALALALIGAGRRLAPRRA